MVRLAWTIADLEGKDAPRRLRNLHRPALWLGVA
ncbi:hypothetical protein [Nonomuraea dietziae]